MSVIKIRVFFVILWIFNIFYIGATPLEDALIAYNNTRIYNQTIDQYWQHPESYFIKRINALNLVLDCIPEDQTDDFLRSKLQKKLEYLQALLPFSSDARCTTKLAKDLTIKTYPVKNCYWAELIDPLHRAGPEILLRIRLWENTDIPNYFIYLETIEEDENLNRFAPIKHSIVYPCTEEKRESFKLSFHDNTAYLNNNLYNTEGNVNLFILDLDEELYVCPKKNLEFHHSSLNGGKRVISAGEIKAQDGRIKFISNTSGHYHPSPDSLLPVLQHLKSFYGNLEDMEVRIKLVYSKGESKTKGMAFYNAEEYLKSGGVCLATRTHNGWTPLHIAILLHHLELSKDLVIPDYLNQPNNNGDTPLHVAIKEKQYEWIPLLIKSGADPTLLNHELKSPLHLASELGDLHSLEKMLEACDALPSFDYPLIHAAAKGGAIENVELLLNHGASLETRDSKGRTVLHAAASDTKAFMIPYLLSKEILPLADTHGTTPLHIAAKRGSISILKKLLSVHDPLTLDVKGNNIAHYAAKNTNSSIMIHIIKSCPQELLNTVNNKGETPLHWAAKNPNLEILKLLLSIKIPLDVKDQKGRTPMHYASRGTNSYTIKNSVLLQKAGENISAPDHRGRTPAHEAVRSGNLVQLMYILTQTQDPNSPDFQGKTLKDYSKKYNQNRIKNYLTGMTPPQKIKGPKRQKRPKGRS